jgi:hypothetical protein
MFKFFRKPIFAIVVVAGVIGLSFQGCGDTGIMGEEDSLYSGDGPDKASFQGADSIFAYRSGLKSALPMTDTEIATEYTKWKNAYVTLDGAGSTDEVPKLRVKRDESSYYDTVSEGVAYGMLISLYCDDMDTFKKLYNYALAHKVDIKIKQGTVFQNVYLMHWKVKADGTNVSEFRLEVTENEADHQWTYLLKDYDGAPNWNKARDEERVYVKSPTQINDPNYLRACQYGRTKSSATDADLDMAAALVLASYRDSSGQASYYRDEAAKMIKAIIKFDCRYNSDYSIWFITNGSNWGGWGKDGATDLSWNPSYFAPAWFKLFIKFINDNKHIASVSQILTDTSEPNPIANPDTAASIIQQVVTNGYNELAKLQTDANRAILPPDWCTSMPGTNALSRGTESDRYYYLNEDRDNEIDDVNGDGVHDKRDYVKPMMSYNFYYDAIRVPWRLAVDYSWYGDTRASNLLTNMRDFFYTKGDGLVDGYTMIGGAWSRSKRDGFNNYLPGNHNVAPFDGLDGGQWTNNTCFNAMCATAFMINDQTKADIWGQRVKNKSDYKPNPDDPEPKFQYYGNTLRMLSLLYMSGRFTNVMAKVSIYSNNPNAAKYVCADSSKGASLPLYASKTSVNNACMFDLVAGTGSTVKIRSYANNLFVGVTGVDSTTALAPTIENGTGVLELTLVKYTTKTAFKWNTQNATRYICPDTTNNRGGRLCTNRSSAGDWEKFTLTPLQ